MLTRKDRGCRSKVLAVNERGVLIEAHWGKDNVNTCFVPEDYFKRKYGVDARSILKV